MKVKSRLLVLILFAATAVIPFVRTDDDDYYYDDYGEYDRDSGYGGGGDSGGINPLAALIAPLAGLALLGAAAAVSVNPVLVQLAVINNGRRRRSPRSARLATSEDARLNEIDLLENFLTKQVDFGHQTEAMVANYLDCSGFSSTENQCLERLVCIYASPEVTREGGSQAEKDVISIILYQLFSNSMVDNQIKTRMQRAGQLARLYGGHCDRHKCPPLDKQK